jgi:hypothetical protein
MSYTIDIVVSPVPVEKRLAWDFVASLKERDDDDETKAPALITLHKALTSVYPCLSSYADDDPAVENCAWTDGPMVDNLGGELATLGLRTSGDLGEVRALVVRIATHLGLTVFDPQEGMIHRPSPAVPTGNTYYVVVRGIRDGFTKQQVVSTLVKLFKRDEAQIRGIFDVKYAYVKKRLGLLEALVYQGVLAKAGCATAIGPEQVQNAPAHSAADYSGMSTQGLHQLAAAGDSNAMYYIGRRFELGDGLPEDLDQAFAWFQKSANLGYAEAQFVLAEMYITRRGNGDVVETMKQYNFWMEKAAAQGHERAIAMLPSKRK